MQKTLTGVGTSTTNFKANMPRVTCTHLPQACEPGEKKFCVSTRLLAKEDGIGLIPKDNALSYLNFYRAHVYFLLAPKYVIV